MPHQAAPVLPRLGVRSKRRPASRCGADLEAPQDRQQLARVGTPRVVGVDLGVGNDPVGPDDVSCRHRQGPAALAVPDRKVVAEAFVDLDQSVREAEAQSELVCERIAVIAENGEAQRVLALRLAKVRRNLRRDCNQRSAEGRMPFAASSIACRSMLQYGHQTPR